MKKKSFIMKNEYFFWCRNFEGLLPSLYCDRKAKQQARAQGRAGRAGRRRGAGLGVRGVLGWRAWGARQGARQAWGARQGARQVGREAGARGRGARQAGSAAGARQQRAGNGRQAPGQARRGRGWAHCVRGWAHGARGARPAWAWPGRWMGAQAGPVLVHCAPGSVLARFLDPVRLGIFLSHQMNTVHGKINF